MKRNLLTFICLIGIGANAQNCIPNTSCIQFDGTSTYVSLNSNSNLNITDSLTIEAWINPNAWGTTSAKNSIVCKHGWYVGEEGYVLRTGGTGELSFNMACDSAGINVSWREVVSSTAVLQLNSWQHVAATFNGTDMKIYINGVLAGTRSFGTQVSITASPDYNMKIGKLADDNEPETRFFSGMIDEVRIWHRALSASEISQNMNHHINPATSVALIGYYRMNENTGNTVSDLGTNNDAGTLIFGTWSTNVPFTDGPPQPYITIAAGYLLNSSASSGNQWYMNGNILAGETNTSYQPTQNGSYTVMVTDSNGCTSTSPPVVVTVLGVENLNLTDKFLRSNDVYGTLKFALGENVLSNSTLRIFDATGKEAYTILNPSKEISLQLSEGVYVVNLSTPNKIYRDRIVVR